ncbi:hypothetical protein M427DRAFT_46019 [Gonapodya prolifera JEL478]|uniref:Uncharacterized protein n=1 Tax=Gonapodya prolifera (strain JEL478) TaxID=1344416 RepID=A0A139A807_GONPJ|nr:hypothetical protein M427DRAFT_46019 [Gonapodya prolifera JEL478]|eukprot:KXS12920.1 hypothetical protein M427DRAFT_46019 [Gonapodya prolifera JEL478]
MRQRHAREGRRSSFPVGVSKKRNTTCSNTVNTEPQGAKPATALARERKGCGEWRVFARGDVGARSTVINSERLQRDGYGKTSSLVDVTAIRGGPRRCMREWSCAGVCCVRNSEGTGTVMCLDTTEITAQEQIEEGETAPRKGGKEILRPRGGLKNREHKRSWCNVAYGVPRGAKRGLRKALAWLLLSVRNRDKTVRRTGGDVKRHCCNVPAWPDTGRIQSLMDNESFLREAEKTDASGGTVSKSNRVCSGRDSRGTKTVTCP